MATSRRINSYANAILRWKLNENTALGTITFANSGTYTSSDMTITGAGTAKAQAIVPGVRGPLSRGVRFPGPKGDGHAGLATGNPATVPAAGAQLTMSIWVMLRSNNNGGAGTVSVFRKNYTTTQGTQPATNLSAGIGLSTGGLVRCFLTTGTNGSGTQTGFNGSLVLPLYVPLHLALTYDGQNGRIYVNGEQDGAALAKTGNLDWNTLGGPWSIGTGWYTQVTTSANSELDGIAEEAVVELGVIPQEMLRARYLRAMSLRAEEAA